MFPYSVTQVAQKKKIEYTPNKTWTWNTNLGVTSADALPLSHRRLVEPKATIKTIFSRHLATLPLFSQPNDVWKTSAEISYWWHVSTQIWVVLLIGWNKFPMRHDQSEALPRSG